MPSFEIDGTDRRNCEMILEFVRRELSNLSVEARMMFLLEITRTLKPEMDELKRRREEANHAQP